jgi:3-phenylpropionate/trans-cinnamate dioxygenase ferredoxin component
MVMVIVAKVGQVPKGGKVGVDANGKPVLVSNVDGNLYAIGNKCTHLGCKLSDGSLSGNVVKCVCHGSMFDARTGKVIGGPAKKDEPAYKVKVVGDDITIDV